MNKLITLYQQLALPDTILTILDDNTGAGYISQKSTDNVLVRWGTYQEGIRILEAYQAADNIPNI